MIMPTVPTRSKMAIAIPMATANSLVIRVNTAAVTPPGTLVGIPVAIPAGTLVAILAGTLVGGRGRLCGPSNMTSPRSPSL